VFADVKGDQLALVLRAVADRAIRTACELRVLGALTVAETGRSD
jgi:hypothetical protein